VNKNYGKLGLVIAVNAVVMFLLTYVLIADIDHFYPNINRMYMTIIMVSPMVILMMLVMRSMYQNKTLNIVLYTLFAVLFVAGVALARTQTSVGDEQFLRSMIPHHSSAIVMCEQADITDPEIADLCEEIVRVQKEEIAIMKEFLEDY
jgi:uncharacterized protein (DUF305 family)